MNSCNHIVVIAVAMTKAVQHAAMSLLKFCLLRIMVNMLIVLTANIFLKSSLRADLLLEFYKNYPTSSLDCINILFINVYINLVLM